MASAQACTVLVARWSDGAWLARERRPHARVGFVWVPSGHLVHGHWQVARYQARACGSVSGCSIYLQHQPIMILRIDRGRQFPGAHRPISQRRHDFISTVSWVRLFAVASLLR